MTQGFLFVTYMIRLIDVITNFEIGFLVSEQFIPREGEFVVSDNHNYRVIEVIHHDDKGEVFLRVEKIFSTRYGNPSYVGVVPTEDDMERVKILALSGQKLEAVKLYKGLTGKGLKECKDYIDSLT